MKKIRVLQIGMSNNSGGVEAFVMNYYRVLAKQSVQFDFVCMYGEIAYKKEIIKLGGRVFEIPNIKKHYIKYCRQLRQIIRNGNYDAVHVNMLSAANIVPLKIACSEGVPKIIAHSHNTQTIGFLRKLMDRCNRARLKKYSNVKLACGYEAGEWLFGKNAMEQGNAIVVNNAINVKKYLLNEAKRKQIREEYGWNGKYVIGHGGRFEEQKNHKFIIKVFARFAKKQPDAVLCLIGDGHLRTEMEEMAIDLGIKDRVFFPGKVSNVADYMSAMDLFLFPSLVEGLPFTLIEAQANGLPCLCSDAITPETYVMDNVETLSLDASTHKWVDKMEEMLNKYVGNPGDERKRFDDDLVDTRMRKKHFDIVGEAESLKRIYEE